MEKCPKFVRSAKIPRGPLSLGGWIIVCAALTAHLVPESQGCLRANRKGSKKTRPSRGAGGSGRCGQNPQEVQILAKSDHPIQRDPHTSPLDRDPSDVASIMIADARRQSSGPKETSVQTGSKSADSIPNSLTPSMTSQLTEEN